MTGLHATRGANFWARRPVTRMDMRVGAFDEIASDEVPGFTEALLGAMPGLVEHRCSIGERGGFVTRLRRGTYAPHIIEHVALELQTMIGHDVGYGRTRGGDEEGEYTLVFEHVHEQVGLRAAAMALEVVQRAFAGSLGPIEGSLHELEALADTPDSPPIAQRVTCGITGGSGRGEAQAALLARLPVRRDGEPPLVIDVAPSYLLRAGLPYARSEIAMILDTQLEDVPPRYQDEERAARLVAVLADGVRRGGVVICPAKAWEVQDLVRDADCRIAIFAGTERVTRRDEKHARSVAMARKGRILIDRCGVTTDVGPLDPVLPVGPQVAAALAALTMTEDCDA